MTTLKITSRIYSEVIDREMHFREGVGMTAYQKIYDAMRNRKTASIDFTDNEVEELRSEADYSSMTESAINPNAGYIKAWRGLLNQIESL
jgi:hypothetical protein